VAVGQFFSQRFSYGIHALAYMATKPAGERTTLPELATWMCTLWPGASNTYLSNVVQRMARGQLLRSHRGITGGYTLARAATDITLRDAVELLEGIDLERCGLSLQQECPVAGHCGIGRRLRELEEGYLDSLAGVSIADLAAELSVPSAQVCNKPKQGRKPA